MTEDQARMTRCCGGEGCGYLNPDDNSRWCIASQCMGWRIEIVESYQQNDHASKKRPEGEGWERLGNFWARTILEQRIGYCGLGGKP